MEKDNVVVCNTHYDLNHACVSLTHFQTLDAQTLWFSCKHWICLLGGSKMLISMKLLSIVLSHVTIIHCTASFNGVEICYVWYNY